MSKRTFLFPVSFKVSTRVSGSVTIEASNEDEAKQKLKELTSDEDEFCIHIRSNGDDDSFNGAEIGEVIHDSISGGYVDKIECNPEEISEIAGKSKG